MNEAKIVDAAERLSNVTSAGGVASSSWTYTCPECGAAVRVRLTDVERWSADAASRLTARLDEIRPAHPFEEVRLDFGCPGCSRSVGLVFARNELSMAHYRHEPVVVVEAPAIDADR